MAQISRNFPAGTPGGLMLVLLLITTYPWSSWVSRQPLGVQAWVSSPRPILLGTARSSSIASASGLTPSDRVLGFARCSTTTSRTDLAAVQPQGGNFKEMDAAPVVEQELSLSTPTAISASLLSLEEEEEEKENNYMAALTSKQPTPILWAWLQSLLESTHHSSDTDDDHRVMTDLKTLAATLALSAMLLAATFSPLPAEAAMSGGRLGGSSWSSPPAATRSAPRSSYRAPSSTTRSYQYYNRRPSVTIVPSVPLVTPFYAPSPFVPSPYLFGGPGVITYSRGPSLFDLVFWGGLGLALFSALRSMTSSVDTVSSSFLSPTTSFSSSPTNSALGPGISLCQITVALEVPNRDDPKSILSVLNGLARTAVTDQKGGVQRLTHQVAMELLRRSTSIRSASTRYKHVNDISQAQRDYAQWSVQERSKFEQETVQRYGGIDYASSSSSSSSLTSPSNGRSSSGEAQPRATMAVVTILLAIQGDSTRIPTRLRSIQDLQEALTQLAANVQVGDCLQSAEILWTPQDRSETLSMREVVADYPELRSL